MSNRNISVSAASKLGAGIRGPNIIGATGGSGTRVVARIVRQGGMFVGSDLNESEDAFEFGDYSDRWINTFVAHRETPLPPAVRAEMDRDLAAILSKHLSTLAPPARAWGWKEPRSIYLLPYYHQQFPNLKYLHIVRDGRDMAFSSNQNQLSKHGATLLGSAEREWAQPLQSIALWSRVNLLAADYGASRLRGRYMLVRFEDLCAAPVRTIRRVFDFFGLEGDVRQIAEQEVHPPASLGRWRHQEGATLTELHRLGTAALERFGYSQPAQRSGVGAWMRSGRFTSLWPFRRGSEPERHVQGQLQGVVWR